MRKKQIGLLLRIAVGRGRIIVLTGDGGFHSRMSADEGLGRIMGVFQLSSPGS